jgi:hypothetical protein
VLLPVEVWNWYSRLGGNDDHVLSDEASFFGTDVTQLPVGWEEGRRNPKLIVERGEKVS